MGEDIFGRKKRYFLEDIFKRAKDYRAQNGPEKYPFSAFSIRESNFWMADEKWRKEKKEIFLFLENPWNYRAQNGPEKYFFP